MKCVQSKSFLFFFVYSNFFREEEPYFAAKQPIYTFYCRAKIAARNILEERPVEVISGIFLAFLTTILLFQFHSKQKQKKLIHHYYLLICKILKEQVLIFGWVKLFTNFFP